MSSNLHNFLEISPAEYTQVATSNRTSYSSTSSSTVNVTDEEIDEELDDKDDRNYIWMHPTRSTRSNLSLQSAAFRNPISSAHRNHMGSHGVKNSATVVDSNALGNEPRNREQATSLKATSVPKRRRRFAQIVWQALAIGKR